MAEQLADGSIDPNVTIPKHIRDAALAAEAMHKQVYEAPPEPEPAAPEPATAPVEQPQEAASASPEPEPQPVYNEPPAPSKDGTKDTNENHESWHHAFLSMQGRWQASQRQLGESRETINQLAAELQATQQLLTQQGEPQQQPNRNKAHEKLITPQDVEVYGQELLDTVQRAARDVVAPELDALRNENEELKKRVITTAKRDVQDALSRSIPDWVAVNRSPEFHQWLSKRNPYVGEVRREILNRAYGAADAALVVQVFKDFLMEAKATGNTVPASQRQSQPPAQPAPAPVQRQPAMQLDQLAAPGRARPASGESSVPAEKPIYSRAQISNNYALRRRGAFNGREADWNALEADMIAAGNEGRVR